MNKTTIYALAVPSVLFFSLASFLYFSLLAGHFPDFFGSEYPKEFMAGMLFSLVSLYLISALFFIKNQPHKAGTIFMWSSVAIPVIAITHIGSPVSLLLDSPVGIALVILITIFITMGRTLLKYRE